MNRPSENPLRRYRLDNDSSAEILRRLVNADTPHLHLDTKKHRLSAASPSGEEWLTLRLPPLFPEILQGEMPKDYLARLPLQPGPYLILLIQAGHGALALGDNGSFIEQKVIRKYMVRKKQGKAQLNYLKTKGKSRAGSRVRLANTVAFFEEINTVISQWTKMVEINRILYSCSPALWGMLFQSRVSVPFEKKDKRLRKIPHDVDTPNREELQRVHQLVFKGELQLRSTLPESQQWLKHFLICK